MKTDDPMMSAVLGDDADFRAATLRDVRRLARRKRRGLALRRGGGALVVIVCVVFFILPRPVAIPRNPPREAFVTIQSEPLAAGEIIRTENGLFSLVGRRPEGLRLVATTPAGIEIFETGERMMSPAFLDDRELLGAFPGRRVAIVDPGTASARLIVY